MFLSCINIRWVPRKVSVLNIFLGTQQMLMHEKTYISNKKKPELKNWNPMKNHGNRN